MTCPVCGNPADPEIESSYGGRTYHFACPRCKERFDQDPEAYLGAAGRRVCH